MEVKRLDSNELYHHGVKGQRWGHRKQRYGDIRDTGGSRPKNTTGNSKGVHRRTNSMGVKETVSNREDDMKYGIFNDHFKQNTAVARRDPKVMARKKETKRIDPYDELQKKLNSITDKQDSNFSSVTTITNSTGNASGISGYGQSKEDLEKEKRSAEYKDAAIALRLENEERIKNSKKFLSKLKLFGEAYTEVHSENIEKGVNFVKKLFKRK
jgi:hypothetical protein